MWDFFNIFIYFQILYVENVNFQYIYSFFIICNTNNNNMYIICEYTLSFNQAKKTDIYFYQLDLINNITF